MVPAPGSARQGRHGVPVRAGRSRRSRRPLRTAGRGQLKSKDAMNELTQARCGFIVATLPEYETMEGNPLMEALKDNRQTPPDEQATFRIDFPAWQGTR